MGFFSVNKEVFPIGICLRGPIKGTRLDSKLNLLLYIHLLKYIKNGINIEGVITRKNFING